MIKERIILGIDPGTTITGYGIIVVENNKARVITMGVIKLTGLGDHYSKLKKIFERILSIIDEFHPDEIAIEAPFYGKNVQSMLKLGRAQGVAMAAALYRSLPIFEYAPRKIKMAITGNGNASKEQVANLLENILDLNEMPGGLDASDGLAAALCHSFQKQMSDGNTGKKSWKNFIANNPGRVKG
ncbi:MAG: crossover junction endodeoxyribonuclease RuvC [Bacteroidales bacterium]|nr:crossover junction endodeoxyribonuclease RuvC [Bacteroidales bacterium]